MDKWIHHNWDSVCVWILIGVVALGLWVGFS